MTKLSKCKFFQVIYSSWENIPFPLPLFIVVLICAEKSAFQGSVTCFALLFKKYIELFGLHNIKGWNIYQIANFLRSEIMFSISLAILYFLIRGYKQSIQLQISNLSSVLGLSLCPEWLNWVMPYFYTYIKYQTHNCQMFHYDYIYLLEMVFNFSTIYCVLLEKHCC